MDIAILNVGEPPTLLINRTRNADHRVLFKLIGAKSNRAAIGRARHNPCRGRSSVQRGSWRRKLSLAERPPSAFWPRRRHENRFRRDPLAHWQSGDAGKYRLRRDLYDCGKRREFGIQSHSRLRQLLRRAVLVDFLMESLALPRKRPFRRSESGAEGFFASAAQINI